MKLRNVWIATAAAVALTVAAGRAIAGPGGCGGGGFGHGGPGRHGMMFPMLLHAVDATPDQKAKLADIMKRHRANVEPLFKEMRSAHDEMASKLLAPGDLTAADLTPIVQHIGQVRQQLMQEWVQAALEARAVLTPDQRAKAADVKQRLQTLRSEMRQLLGHESPTDSGGAED